MKRNLNFWVRTLVAVLLVLVLTGCSGGESSTELYELQKKNEALQLELDVTKEKLNAAELKIESLEERLAEASKPEQQPVLKDEDIVPRELEVEEVLLGEWFDQGIHDDNGRSWSQSMVFYENGKGSIVQTYYVPDDTLDWSTSDTTFTGEVARTFSWSLDGEKLHVVVTETGEIGDFTFLAEEQQFFLAANSNLKFERTECAELKNYINLKVFLGGKEAKKAALMRNLLGTWYFDVFTWKFNEDGTGSIEIPKLGDQPATTREFSYSLDISPSETSKELLIMEWEDNNTSYHKVKMNGDGSMTLDSVVAGVDDVRLTRKFDRNNCPVSEAIIANGIGVLSGSIFYDLLP